MARGSLMENVSSSGGLSVPSPSDSDTLLLQGASSFKENMGQINQSLSDLGRQSFDQLSAPIAADPECSPSSNPQGLTVELPDLCNNVNLSSPPVPPPSPTLTPRTPTQLAFFAGPKLRQPWHNCADGTTVPKEVVSTWDHVFSEGCNTDVVVCTDDGRRIAAHSMILAASSPVFRAILEDQGKRARPTVINLPGVPFHAARCFIRYIYSSRYEPAEFGEYGLILVVLGHAYMIPALKRACTQHYEHGLLNNDNVVDVLQVARLCDVPRLHLLCFRRIVSEFKVVARSEGWRAMRESDPALEQELLDAVIKADRKKQNNIQKLEGDKVYEQLHDAMEALVHICRDGCETIGPHNKPLDEKKQGGCKFVACKGLESLVRHFACCKLKVAGGCVHCKRMWQLLELHSRMCLDSTNCKVPLCRHFKEQVGQQQASKKEEMRWKMIVSKVRLAKTATSTFSLAAVSAELDQVT